MRSCSSARLPCAFALSVMQHERFLERKGETMLGDITTIYNAPCHAITAKWHHAANQWVLAARDAAD